MRISAIRTVVAVAAVAAAAVMAFMLLAPARVHVVKPEKRMLVQEVFGTGTVEARVLVRLGSKISGRVREVYVDEGDRVKAGQVVAVLVSDDLGALADEAGSREKMTVSGAESAKSAVTAARSALDSAEADIERNAASLELAKKTYERYENLYRKGVVSSQDRDEKKAALDESESLSASLLARRDAAGAELARARAELDSAMHEMTANRAAVTYAGARLDDTVIRSSIDGVVVSRDAEPGDAVVAGSPVLSVADPETVWVEADIDESLTGGIVVGAPARVRLRSEAAITLSGTVARLSQESDRVTEELRVDVRFEKRDPHRLHLGEQAEVYVRGFEKEARSIPVSAVTLRDGVYGVFVNNGGRARFTPVTTGIWTDEMVEIAGGVTPDDQVILIDGRDGRKMKDGKRVRAEMTGDG